MFSPVHNYTINLSTTTDTVQGEGSQVITRLQPALKIPLTAHDIVVSLRSSFIYNTFPNVTTTIGNALYLKTTEMADFRVFVLPDGQYDVANLDSSFQFLIANDPTATELVGTFELNATLPPKQSVSTIYQLTKLSSSFLLVVNIAMANLNLSLSIRFWGSMLRQLLLYLQNRMCMLQTQLLSTM